PPGRPGLRPRAGGAVDRARRAILFRQLPQRLARRQVRPCLPHGRRAGARAAEIPRHAQPAELRLCAGRAGQALSPSHDLPRFRGSLLRNLLEHAVNATSGKLRSRAWFDNPDNIDMTALYLERYLNFGLSLDEL